MAARVDVIDLPRRVIFVRVAAHWSRWQGHVMGGISSIPFNSIVGLLLISIQSQFPHRRPITSPVDNLVIF